MTVLAEELGVEAMEFDEEGTSAALFNERFEVVFHLRPAEGVISVMGEIVPFSACDEVVMREMLAFNFAGLEGHHPSIALEDESDLIVLVHSLPLDPMAPEKTRSAFRDFLEAYLACIGPANGEDDPLEERLDDMA